MKSIQNDYKTASWLIFHQTVPNLLERTAEIASGFLNNMFLANSSNPAILPASGLISIIQMFFLTVGNITLMGVGSAISEEKSNETEKDKIGKVFRYGLRISAVWAAIMFSLTFWIKPILIGTGQYEDLSTIVQDYFRAYAWTILPSFFLSTEKQLVSGVFEKPYSIAVIEFINCTLTTTLAYFMINGKGGFSEYGAAGLGYADAISTSVSFILFTGYLLSRTDFKEYKLISRQLPDSDTKNKILGNGIPAGIQYGIELITAVIATVMVGTLGPVSLAAQQVALQYILFVLAIILSIARAAMYCTSQNKEKKELIKPISIVSHLAVVFVPAIATLLFYYCSEPLQNLFIDNHVSNRDAILALGSKLMWFGGLTLIPDGIRYVGGFSLLALNEPATGLAGVVLGLAIIGLPVGWALALKYDYGAFGMAEGRGLGILVAAILVGWRTIVNVKKCENTDTEQHSIPLLSSPGNQ